MKKLWLVSAGLAFILISAFILKAQDAADVAAELQAVESMPTISASQFEASGLEGAFYSAQHAPGTENEWPPLPGNWLSLPIWVIDTNLFLIDDLNYDYNAASQAASKASSQRGGGIHAMDESGGGGFSPDFSFATNSLWLQMINVTNDTAYLTLNNATDSVYEIWSKTDLTLTNWNIEQELWPTNTNSMPFTVLEQDRTNLFIWARDWTGITSNGNETPEWWFWKYFDTVDLSDTNLDSLGNTLLDDYENGADPNVIQFSLLFTNDYFNSSPAYGTISVQSGIPSYIAVLVNDTNQADAVWQPYTSTNIAVPLDSGNGTYAVSVGLRGLPTNAVQTWLGAQLTLNTVAPMLTVTNPATGTVSVPMIQLQGYVNESLGKLTFDVSNATGIFTNQTGYWQPAFYDTNQLTFTTNSFQCYDIPLTNGVNVITLHATDLEGNMTTTNFSCTLSYAGVTNPPALTLLWPTNDTAIGGTNFTLQAQVDDATATISAAINGNTVQGIVERSGAVWVKNLPLNSGTNTVTLTATNAAGNVSTTNFDVVRSAVSVTVDPLPAAELNQSSVTVTGMVGNPGDNVTVNGVGAYYTDDAGDWEADGVPVSPSGTASVDVEVTDSDDNPVASQMSDQLQPVTVVLSSYCAVDSVDSYDSYYQSPDDQNRTLNWLYGLGGTDHEFGIVPTGEGSPRSNPYDDSEGIPADLSGYYGGPESENAALGTTTLSGDGYDDVISIERSIQSKLMIMPQGQATAGTTQLYLVEVTAAELTDPIYLYFTNMLSPEGLQVNGQPVVNSGITNEDGSMPGLALVSGAAGAPVPLSVTETRALQYQDFTNGIQATNVQLKIVANGTTLDSITTNAEFCVGQQVTFSNYFCPPISNIVANTTIQWVFTGNYVNNYTPGSSSSSTNYFEDSNELTNDTTSSWWVSGGTNPPATYTASLAENLTLSNGQQIVVTAKGLFNMVRPQAKIASQTTSVNINEDDYGHTYLMFADIPTNGITFLNTVSIPTNFPGSIVWVQVVSNTVGNLEDTNSTWHISTQNGSNPYGDYPIPYAQFDLSGTNPVDSPYLILSGPSYGPFVSAVASGSFEMWMMFQPSDTGSIAVPLRAVDWSWSGSATNIAGTWTLESGVTNSVNPTDFDTQTFPLWNSNVGNSTFIPSGYGLF